MDLKKLRSDIKAYAIEIMGETSTSGGAGAYLTKLREDPKVSNRKANNQDLKSPTGFESSPNPNMYTKTMKFKIVKPESRINSVDLWDKNPKDPKFDSMNEEIERGEMPDQDTVHGAFEKWGREIHYLYWKPVADWDEYDLSNWKSLVRKDGKYNYGNGENIKESKTIECTSCGWSWKLSEGGKEPYLCHKCGHINSPLNEARYSQFKKQTLKRTPREQLHKAVKEIQMKMDEVNRLVDFTSKMKQELKETEEELKYLKRTKNSLYKIQEKIQYISNKIKTITE